MFWLMCATVFLGYLGSIVYEQHLRHEEVKEFVGVDNIAIELTDSMGDVRVYSVRWINDAHMREYEEVAHNSATGEVFYIIEATRVGVIW